MDIFKDRQCVGIILVAWIIFVSILYSRDRDGLRWSREIEKNAEVIALKEKYPREGRVISKLAVGVMGLRDYQDFLIGVPRSAFGSASCMKHLYGEDGVAVVKALGFRVNDDDYLTADECYEKYGVSQVVGR